MSNCVGTASTPMIRRSCFEASGGFDEDLAASLLQHSDPFVRIWTTRLIGDEGKLSETIERSMIELARNESHPLVRSQLACTAKRLPARVALPVVEALANHAEDLPDRYQPLLLWWVVEAKLRTEQASTLRWLDQNHYIAPITLGITLYVLGEWLGATHARLGTSGWQLVVVALFCSTTLLYHVTFAVNSIGHLFGRRRYETNDESRNSLWLALVTGGGRAGTTTTIGSRRRSARGSTGGRSTSPTTASYCSRGYGSSGMFGDRRQTSSLRARHINQNQRPRGDSSGVWW